MTTRVVQVQYIGPRNDGDPFLGSSAPIPAVLANSMTIEGGPLHLTDAVLANSTSEVFTTQEVQAMVESLTAHINAQVQALQDSIKTLADANDALTKRIDDMSSDTGH